VFPKIGVPQNGLLKMENPIKMDDLGVPLFSETPIYKYPVKEASLQCLYGFLTKFINLALSTLVGMGRRPKYKRISRIILRGIY